MNLTPELAKEYVESFGTQCPFCESDDIEGTDWDLGTGQYWRYIRCNSCGKKWTDVYTLTSIEERE